MEPWVKMYLGISPFQTRVFGVLQEIRSGRELTYHDSGVCKPRTRSGSSLTYTAIYVPQKQPAKLYEASFCRLLKPLLKSKILCDRGNKDYQDLLRLQREAIDAEANRKRSEAAKEQHKVSNPRAGEVLVVVHNEQQPEDRAKGRSQRAAADLERR